MTSIFFFVELVVGHVTKSNSLFADSFHMLSDIISQIIGLTALRFSKKESSSTNTFGWSRAEVLGSLINAVFLLALCFTIVIDSVTRFLDPEQLVKIDLMLIVGGIGLALNLVVLLLFAIIRFQDSAKQKNEVNMNLHGVFLNAIGDSLGSVAVIVSGLVIKYASPKDETNVKWKLYIDPILSLIIAGVIVSSTVPQVKKSGTILLQAVPDSCKIDELQKKISEVEGVVDVHHFHVWSLNAEKLVATAHIRLKDDNDGKSKVVEKIKKILHKNNIHLTTIQLENDQVAIESCDEECPELFKKSKPSESKLKKLLRLRTRSDVEYLSF